MVNTLEKSVLQVGSWSKKGPNEASLRAPERTYGTEGAQNDDPDEEIIGQAGERVPPMMLLSPALIIEKELIHLVSD